LVFYREITELLPTLLHLLNTPYMSQAIGVLVEILMTSVFMDGKATKITTEPLLDWFAGRGGEFVREAVASQYMHNILNMDKQSY